METLEIAIQILSNWQYASIGSGNGLASNRWQAIIRSNDNPVYRPIYVALGGSGGWGVGI